MATSKAISAKSKGKLTKKELKQDRLVEYTVKVESFYHQNKKWVVGVLTAIVVVIVATVVITRSQQSSRLGESYELTMAKMNYGAGKLDDAKQGFEKIASQYSGKTAGEAKLFTARIAFEQGDFTSAEAGFKGYIADYSVDDALDAAAFSGLAASLEAQGKLSEALEQYQKLADKYPNVPYAPESLLQVSRLAQKLNLPEKARLALQRILDKYSESSEVQQARKDLETLE
jgi:TolA-binding protein